LEIREIENGQGNQGKENFTKFSGKLKFLAVKKI